MATRTVVAFPAARTRPAPIGVRQAWTVLCAMVRARQTRRMLAEMDHRMMADVGISPSDAHMEASRPFWDLARRR